jgi:hypothetical protein
MADALVLRNQLIGCFERADAMPRWDRRLRIVLDWTVAIFFWPDITRVDLRVEREHVTQARRLVGSRSL